MTQSVPQTFRNLPRAFNVINTLEESRLKYSSVYYYDKPKGDNEFLSKILVDFSPWSLFPLGLQLHDASQ